MKLEKQEIEKMIHNVLSYEFDEKGKLLFHRFSKSQEDTYEGLGGDWICKANASASVTFDFITDADFIVLRVNLIAGSSRDWCAFDCYVDGIFFAQREFSGAGSKLMGFDLPKGEHRVTIYFPWTKISQVQAVQLTDGAFVREVDKKKRLLAFGDSITQGYDARCASLSYVNQVARNLDMEVVNQGIGGFYFDKATIDESITSYKPDIITIAYGTNDYSRYDDEEEFRRLAGEYLEKLTALFPDTKILGILPFYRGDQGRMIREMYRTYTFWDARNILKEIYETYDNVRVLEETKMPRISRFFMEDYLHPNDAGFTFIANAVGEAIRKLL